MKPKQPDFVSDRPNPQEDLQAWGTIHCSHRTAEGVWQHNHLIVDRRALFVVCDNAHGVIDSGILKDWMFAHSQVLDIHYKNVWGACVGEIGWLRTGGVSSQGKDIYVAVEVV